MNPSENLAMIANGAIAFRDDAARRVVGHSPGLLPNGRADPDQARPWAINDNLKSRDGQWTPRSALRLAVMAERAEPILNKLAISERRIEWSAAALAFAILLQTGGIVWWGSSMNQRMATVEQKISATASAGETIARLDERTAAMITTIDRIDRRVSVAEERQAARDYGR